MTSEPTDCDVVVVGAGFAGLYAIHKVRGMGLRVQGFELGSDVGGVWFWNRYPGARCDVESLQYSYSFSEQLEQDWVWSERFAPQAEILAYLRHVADRFDLRRSIRFDTRVVQATFDEGTSTWQVRTSEAGTCRARFMVMASGSLSVSRFPDIPGISRFKGQNYHTGAWPSGQVDFRGKRVGLVGTGSSGVQATPVIAAEAERLFVFQRSPSFVIPARNALLDVAVQQAWKKDYRQHRARAKDIGTFYDRSETGAMEVDAEQREADYHRRWSEGGVNFMYTYKDIYLDQAANDTAAEFVRARISDIVADPEVARRLTPTDHPIGTKRIVVGSHYYETFNRSNVQLVDIRADPILEITETGISTTAQLYELDVIVFATGYDALTGAITRIDIRGRGGRSFKEKWAGGPRNYLGLMSAGFPNLFIITGPGSPSVLINMVVAIEQHVEWIADCLAYLRTHRLTTIEPTVPAEDAWVAHVNAEADSTLFPRANSWYVGANVPGKPRVFLPYVGGIARYRSMCDEAARTGYQGFTLG